MRTERKIDMWKQRVDNHLDALGRQLTAGADGRAGVQNLKSFKDFKDKHKLPDTLERGELVQVLAVKTDTRGALNSSLKPEAEVTFKVVNKHSYGVDLDEEEENNLAAGIGSKTYTARFLIGG